MPPALLSLAVFGIEELIKHEPEIADAIATIFAKGKPTPEDWNTLRLMILAGTYKQLVPNTQLPDAETT